MTDVVWYTHCPIPTATSIARARGLLAAELGRDGIAIETLRSSPDPEVRDSHFTHVVPNSFRHGGNFPPIFARSRGSDVRLIGLSWSDLRHPVLVMPDSDVVTAADLRGRRLSVPRRPHATIDFFRATALRTYDRILAAAGLTFDDVELVDVEIADDNGLRSAADGRRAASLADTAYWMGRMQREEVVALVRGGVDAIAGEAQVAVTLEATLGLRVVADILDFDDRQLRVNNPAPAALTVSGALLEENPQLVARWLAQVLDAAAWARDHEDEAKPIMAREAGVHEDFVDWAYSAAVHTQLDVDLAPDKLAALRSQHDHLLAHGFIDTPVDLDAFVAHEPLAAARELLAQRAVGAGS
jgi:ABC-type nitrate/sulfonate/bicarbonate transport system substrate-binding protein